MQVFLNRYFLFLQKTLSGLLILLLIPVLLQVFSRLIPFIPRYIWTEELARFAFVWIIMLGSSVAVRDQSHFYVDLLPNSWSKYGHLLRLVGFVFMLLLALVFLIGGYYFTQFGATQHSEIAGLPMWVIYIAWPLAGLSWILFLVEQVYQEFRSRETI
ncbi:MAG: TRAP transporter small permease [Bacteroidota bacterium]